ncbi:MAG: hypothetical protein II397_12530, partial [Treponema sp.]|nr:hypothetical protein [Treponema sp.]
MQSFLENKKSRRHTMQSLATLVCLLPLFYNLSNLPLFVFKLGLCVELGVVEDCVAVLDFL